MEKILYSVIKEQIPTFTKGDKTDTPDFYNHNKYGYELKCFKNRHHLIFQTLIVLLIVLISADKTHLNEICVLTFCKAIRNPPIPQHRSIYLIKFMLILVNDYKY